MNSARRTILLERRRRERDRQTVRFSSARRSTIGSRDAPDDSKPKIEEKKFDFGCLKGEEHLITPKAIHRLFEDNLMRNLSHEKIALIYEGKCVINYSQ